ncbi:MAG: cupredoxin domain-containing protein [Candidatus Dormibacteraeota bacterium]|nr:cupredoxin domain-containing protein [Candidatus Dormibacteraeota bacterium]
MKKVIAFCAAVGVAMVLGVVMIVGWSVGRGVGYDSVTHGAGAGNATGAVKTPTHVYLVIHQGEQLGNEPLGPAYLPATFTLPAYTTVTITIINFDSATALPATYAKYAKASGIDKNSFQMAAMDPTNPNAKVASATMSSVEAAQVSHTFTFPELNLSVPIAAQSSTTFSFHTPAGGTYAWHCQDPCGIGPVGWGGAMSTDGYMQGHVTFA